MINSWEFITLFSASITNFLYIKMLKISKQNVIFSNYFFRKKNDLLLDGIFISRNYVHQGKWLEEVEWRFGNF